MADFKKDFANHINVIGTNPYLFIGSGLSRRYLNMPTWLNLLKDFSEKLLLQKGFGYYDSKSEGNLPELASLMASEFHETWWTNPAFSDSRKEYENKRIGSQEIPFKIELSKFVSNHKDFQEDYSEEIELLKKVVIDGIITTNWDTFLEATFSDYKTYIGQEQLLFSENISIGEIYKIHGCVTSPESLIVSSNDYANFKKRNAYLAAKLLTIFVEHPVIFLGYSISDPNILELLFSLKDCLAAHNIEKLKDRLIFVEWRAEQNEPIMIDGTLSLSDGKILPIKHIKINSFIPLFDVLANLKQRLPIKILRRFKDAVYEFVKTNEPTNKIYIGDLTNIDENGNDIEFVVGVGVANSIAKQGLLGICVDDVVEDVLFDNKHIPAKEFITDAIPKLLKKRIRIPLYKYYRAEIDKIYTFSHNEQTYYVLISYWYNQAYFEIVAIQNGDFIPHSEFYPKQFQDNIKDGCVEFYGGPDSYVDLEFDSQALTINYTFYSYMGQFEEHGQTIPKYKKTEQKTVKLNIE